MKENQRRYFTDSSEVSLGTKPHSRRWIYALYKQLRESGFLSEGKTLGRQPVTEETADVDRQMFARSPRNSPRHANGEQQRPYPTRQTPYPAVWKIVRKLSQVQSYRFKFNLETYWHTWT